MSLWQWLGLAVLFIAAISNDSDDGCEPPDEGCL